MSEHSGESTATDPEVHLASALLDVLRHHADSWTEIIVKRTYRPDAAFVVTRDTEGLRVTWPSDD